MEQEVIEFLQEKGILQNDGKVIDLVKLLVEWGTRKQSIKPIYQRENNQIDIETGQLFKRKQVEKIQEVYLIIIQENIKKLFLKLLELKYGTDIINNTTNNE